MEQQHTDPLLKLVEDFIVDYTQAPIPLDGTNGVAVGSRHSLLRFATKAFEEGWRRGRDPADLGFSADWPGPHDDVGGVGSEHVGAHSAEGAVVFNVGPHLAQVPTWRARAFHRKLGQLLDNLEAGRRYPNHPSRCACETCRGERAEASRRTQEPTVLGDVAMFMWLVLARSVSRQSDAALAKRAAARRGRRSE
jgi:hypothetical protein